MAMSDSIRVGDRVQIYLDSKRWGSEGWYEGTVVRIDPYSEHRSFHWVELDDESAAQQLARQQNKLLDRIRSFFSLE